MKYLLIIAIVLLASCSQIDPSIVHTDGDYVITMEKDTDVFDEDMLMTQVLYKGGLMYNSYLAFEEKHYVEINLDTLFRYKIGENYAYSIPSGLNSRTVRDELYRYVITFQDSLTHIDHIDSLGICNELGFALLHIERDKSEHIADSVSRANKQSKIDLVEYWRNNVKEICKE